MLQLLRNSEIFGPEKMGVQDVLLDWARTGCRQPAGRPVIRHGNTARILTDSGQTYKY